MSYEVEIESLFERNLTQGRIRSLLARFLHRGIEPDALGTCIGQRAIFRQSYAGLLGVPLDQIKGSENPTQFFNREFYPVKESNRHRWMRIARLRGMGISLPPVLLLRMDGSYYVRDGHHRVSVARAMGEEFIDAEVIDLHCD